MITRRDLLGLKGPSEGNGGGRGRGRGRGRGGRHSKVVTQEESEDDEVGVSSTAGGSKDVPEDVEDAPRKPLHRLRGKSKVDSETGEVIGKGDRKAKTEKPKKTKLTNEEEKKAETSRTEKKTKAKREAEPKAKSRRVKARTEVTHEPNERMTKTMQKFLDQVDQGQELEALKKQLKLLMGSYAFQHATFTPYWTRPSCTVRKWDGESWSWTGCAHFSWDATVPPGNRSLKLIIAVAAAVRLVSCLLQSSNSLES